MERIVAVVAVDRVIAGSGPVLVVTVKLIVPNTASEEVITVGSTGVQIVLAMTTDDQVISRTASENVIVRHAVKSVRTSVALKRVISFVAGEHVVVAVTEE